MAHLVGLYRTRTIVITCFSIVTYHLISNHLVIIRGDNRVTIAIYHTFYCHLSPSYYLLPITYDSMPITYYLLLITYYVPLYPAPAPIQQIAYATGIFHL